jgi:hypothetical protein
MFNIQSNQRNIKITYTESPKQSLNMAFLNLGMFALLTPEWIPKSLPVMGSGWVWALMGSAKVYYL